MKERLIVKCHFLFILKKQNENAHIMLYLKENEFYILLERQFYLDKCWKKNIHTLSHFTQETIFFSDEKKKKPLDKIRISYQSGPFSITKDTSLAEDKCSCRKRLFHDWQQPQLNARILQVKSTIVSTSR